MIEDRPKLTEHKTKLLRQYEAQYLPLYSEEALKLYNQLPDDIDKYSHLMSLDDDMVRMKERQAPGDEIQWRLGKAEKFLKSLLEMEEGMEERWAEYYREKEAKAQAEAGKNGSGQQKSR